MHKVAPLPFFPLPPPTYVQYITSSPFLHSLSHLGKLQTSRWPSSVRCSRAKPDYSIPSYSNPYWTIQPHTTGLPNCTHTINTCQVLTTYIRYHMCLVPLRRVNAEEEEEEVVSQMCSMRVIDISILYSSTPMHIHCIHALVHTCTTST